MGVGDELDVDEAEVEVDLVGPDEVEPWLEVVVVQLVEAGPLVDVEECVVIVLSGLLATFLYMLFIRRIGDWNTHDPLTIVLTGHVVSVNVIVMVVVHPMVVGALVTVVV